MSKIQARRTMKRRCPYCRRKLGLTGEGVLVMHKSKGGVICQGSHK